MSVPAEILPRTTGMDEKLPLADEPFVSTWEEYVSEATQRGVIPTLRDKLIQLRFPIERGISATPEYQAATRSGRWPTGSRDVGIRFNDADAVELILHPSLVGRVPVLTVPDRRDFVALVRALTRRNEPDPIPTSVGACLVSGFNNWDRVARARADWQARFPLVGESGWYAEFASLKAQPERFQDRFIILSTGPYSGVPAGELGIPCLDPDRFALTLRREHELVHLFCRRVWGRLRDPILEEIIADFVGILAAAGEFRAEWMLRFFGIEDPDRPHAEGRLQNYLGEVAPNFSTRRKLYDQIVAAAHNLEAFAAHSLATSTNPNWKLEVLTTLPTLSLQTLAERLPNR